MLIKRLIQKGLLKIEHISAKTIRYILTPKGLMEKARLTYQYIIISYNYISDIESKIEQIVRNKRSTVKIALYGDRDELYNIIMSKLHAIGEKYQYIENPEQLKDYSNEKYIIVIWSPSEVDHEINNQSNIINILRMV